jgi:Tol biopolymer transport system component
MQPDGTDVQQLTHLAARSAFHPAWSPDGTQVAFEGFTVSTQSRQIYVINADGTGQHRMFADEFFEDLSPGYSPDGSKVIFTRCRPDYYSCAIAVARSDGRGHVTNLTAFVPDAGADDPVYSPDGSRIAYSGYYFGGAQIATYVMHADGTHARRITPPSKRARFPDWAPDGSVLAVIHCCDLDPSRLWTVHPDGTGLTKIVSGARISGSSFAPEGDQIAFQDGGAIWVANADGSNAVLVQGNAFEPAWGSEAGA